MAKCAIIDSGLCDNKGADLSNASLTVAFDKMAKDIQKARLEQNIKYFNEHGCLMPMLVDAYAISAITETFTPFAFVNYIMHSQGLQVMDKKTDEWISDKLIDCLEKIKHLKYIG